MIKSSSSTEDTAAAPIRPSASAGQIDLRVALVHHWLTRMRGGEKVLEALCTLFPDADIHTLVCDPRHISETLRRHHIVTSFIQRLPFGRRRFRMYLPLFPLAVEEFDLTSYDLVLTSDASIVKGVLVRPDALHICYCHSPPRYAWDLYHTYRSEAMSGPLQRLLAAPVLHYLRVWDSLAAQRVDVFVANSRAVAARIARYYRRSAHVIYPPVETTYFAAATRDPEDFYLFAGQLTAYKQPRLAIEACTALGRKLIVVGDGPQRRALMRRYRNITFTGWIPNEALRDYYARCRALIFPGEEDFGIVPVEAQAAGAPVIAFSRGGALESIVEDETGVFFHQPSADALARAIHHFEENEKRFHPDRCRANANRFDRSIFLQQMQELIEQTLATRSGNATTPAEDVKPQ